MVEGMKRYTDEEWLMIQCVTCTHFRLTFENNDTTKIPTQICKLVFEPLYDHLPCVDWEKA